MTPAELAKHYTECRVADRVLLTGHSHQAWPDVAKEGLDAAFADATEHLDDKWGRALEQDRLVRAGFARRIGAATDELVIAPSTHDLLVRLLSALPMRRRRRIVTTDGEFHSAARQLRRIEEEGVEVVRVSAANAATLSERLAAQVDDQTLAVLTSSVMFQTSTIVPNLQAAARAAALHGAECIIDAYHHINVVPFDLGALGLDGAWVLGGGYKYCQLGEGNAFLRVPPGPRAARPAVTGWFSVWQRLSAPQGSDVVPYPAGADRFRGATWDPASVYRGARVWRFFDDLGLDVPTLRATSQRQVARLRSGIQDLDLPDEQMGWASTHSLEENAGFLAIRCPDAARVREQLKARGVSTDHRGDILRLGPAPYVTDAQIDGAISALGEAVTR